MLIIGLGYKARQGKDTLANFIKKEYGEKYPIRLYSFAEELKREVNEWYEKYGDWSKTFTAINQQIGPLPEWVVIDHTDTIDDPLCPYGKQRTLLQWYGTEYRRAKSPNYWVRKLSQTIKKDIDIRLGIVTDVRFPNEYKWVKSFGRDGITVCVKRRNAEAVYNHTSETSLDGYEFDYIVEADSLEDLEKDAKELFELVRKREVMPEEFKDFSV
jgi:hypothetical protein